MTARANARGFDSLPPEPSHYGRLLELAHQRAVDGKGGLAASVAEMCLASNSGLSERELQLAFEIIRLILPRVDVKIRRHIADYLADRSDTPHDLIRRLAGDNGSVAYPVILHSALLREDDLLEIVTTGTKHHRQAVAIRPNITSRLTRELIVRDEPAVLLTLLCNEAAEIDQDSLSCLVERSLENTAYQEPLLHRKEMTAGLARRLYIWAEDSLRDYIDTHYAAETSNPAAAQHERTDADAAVPQAGRHRQVEQQVEEAGAGRKLLACLDLGDIAGFEVALAAELDLPLSSVTAILYDSDPETLATACKAYGMDKSVFGEILCLLQRAQPTEGYDQSPEYQRAMDYFEQIDYASASVALNHWRIAPRQARRA